MMNHYRLKVLILLALAATAGACATTRTVRISALVQGDGRMLDRRDQRPYTGQVTQLHPNKLPALAGAYRQGKKHGTWTAWYAEAGRVETRAQYTDGQLDGPWRSWWKNGKKKVEGIYRADLRQGPWTEWDEKGQPIFKGTYQAGRKHGPWLSWHGNGKQEEQGVYRQGKRHGTWAFFNEGGTLSSKVEYEDGKQLGQWTRAGAQPAEPAPPTEPARSRPGVPEKKVPEKKVRVVMYVMSQCPFGVRAVNAMKEVLKNFGRRVTFKIHFVGDVKDGKPTSLHGQSEVDENIRQLCAMKHYPRRNKYLDYIWCRNTGNDWRTDDWKKCATKGISAQVIERCFKGPGTKMLIKDIAVAKKLSFGASPTWLANNRYKFSGITAEVIKTEVCKRNPKLKNCDKKLSGSTAPVQGGCGK